MLTVIDGFGTPFINRSRVIVLDNDWHLANIAVAILGHTQSFLWRMQHVMVQRRPPEAPVRIGVLERVDNIKRGRGRPKLTWDESVKKDLKDWNISKEIVLDRSAWRLAINVPEP